MFVFVLSINGKPLMPTNPAKARVLLKTGKAKVIRTTPFTIKLLYETTEYTQPVIAGMDTGSKKIGCAAVSNDVVLYQSEIEIRDDVSGKMQQKSMYRRNRRSRKTRYRQARFNNRGNSTKSGRIAPSIRSKIESHLRERNFVESILPVTKWAVELASFDIHKITNPDVSGIEYQNGNQKGFYNTKAYVLNRDSYTCQHCKGKSKDPKLDCHHIIFRSNHGTDAPENLITLCHTCHSDLHAGKFKLSTRKSKTKHATEIGIVKSQLKKIGWEFQETFGYETKFKRKIKLDLPKTHYNDAVAICCDDNQQVQTNNIAYYKKHVCAGDYQQRKGQRSEKKIPTGKLFGIRKFDLIKTSKGIGFVKGRISTGYAVLMDIFGKTTIKSTNINKNCTRLTARSTTLVSQFKIEQSLTHSSPTCQPATVEEGVFC